ncbi:hypothetical protein [Desulfosporosinus sp.]|uniref:hypothetical protein n=1 Tax=Desulfosporosinus sp. TaxID=157907 RepID=UPI002636C484|nr:hypothetical protein [Desulfosporosinus sp.]
MSEYVQELNDFIEILLKLLEPTDGEVEELKSCIHKFGIDIFNHLDYVDLPLEQLEKLDAIRILISKGKEGN